MYLFYAPIFDVNVGVPFLYVPPEYTGKNTHTYIDDCKEGYLTDYKGIKSYYKEMTSVHLSPSDYSLSLAKEYSDYIANVQDVYL